MTPPLKRATHRAAAVSTVIYVVSVGAMAWLRLIHYRDSFVTLTYGLPLMLCLWHPSRRLLWAMAGTFVAMAAYKAGFVLPHQGDYSADRLIMHALMQAVNVLVIAGALHVVLRAREQTAEKQALLESTNAALVMREEEIARQNEELQTQAEELGEQNEELTRQTEELQQQADELQAQAEEMQAMNVRLMQREEMLATLLQASQTPGGRVPETIAGPLLALFQDVADAVAIVENVQGELTVIARAGPQEFVPTRGKFEQSFAAVVLAQEQTGYVADLALRPDLVVQSLPGVRYRSVLATPLRFAGRPIGAIEVYSRAPREWTAEEFRIVEWASSQCALFLQVRRLNAELRTVNASLDRQVAERTEELRRVVAELEHFSYTITHDMRAPLRAMQGFSAIILEESGERLDEECRGYLRRIGSAANRMDRLITDALSFTHAAKCDLPIGPVDVGHLLRQMIASYPTFAPPHAQVTVANALPPVLGNEAGLTQCFSNLISNAVKFVPPGRQPTVRIWAEPRPGVVRYWIEDNGIGIPAEYHSRLFAMFQRLNREYEGTGIGLALVKTVVQRMGGAVGVESEDGKGSRFWLELKAGESEASARAGSAPSTAVPTMSAS